MSQQDVGQAIALAMAGLEPGWREEGMDEDWAENSLPFPLAEYLRIRDWWDDSGAFDDTWRFLVTDLAAFYPPVASGQDDEVIATTERVNFLVELYDWWMVSDLEEFISRVSDGGSVEAWPPDEDEWQSRLRAWWESGGPDRTFAFIAERTKDFRPSIATDDAPGS